MYRTNEVGSEESSKETRNWPYLMFAEYLRQEDKLGRISGGNIEDVGTAAIAEPLIVRRGIICHDILTTFVNVISHDIVTFVYVFIHGMFATFVYVISHDNVTFVHFFILDISTIFVRFTPTTDFDVFDEAHVQYFFIGHQFLHFIIRFVEV